MKVNFRYQGFRSTPITPAIPKAQTTRHQVKIQPHPQWNSSTQLATKPTVTKALPGIKKTLEDLRLPEQPFRAKPVPGGTYKPFRPVLSKDRTSVIDRRNRKIVQELAKREMSIQENIAKDFKPEPFRAKLLPVSTYKPYRPVLSKDRQQIKRRIAFVKKPMILMSPADVNDTIESENGTEQLAIAAEEASNGAEQELENQSRDDVESDEVEVMPDEVEVVPGEDVEESETGENPDYSEEPAGTIEESEIVDVDQETADEELDNGDEVPVTEDVDAPTMPEAL